MPLWLNLLPPSPSLPATPSHPALLLPHPSPKLPRSRARAKLLLSSCCPLNPPPALPPPPGSLSLPPLLLLGLEDIKALPYTRATLAESLRMYPQPPLLIRRSLAPDTLPPGLGGPPEGYPIGKGADLFISVWNLHRSPHLWKDPDTFRPERFTEVFTNPAFGGAWAGEGGGGGAWRGGRAGKTSGGGGANQPAANRGHGQGSRQNLLPGRGV